jgi:hypothetical protein
MNAVTYDDARLGLMLTELRLPTIGRLWPDFTGLFPLWLMRGQCR